MHTLPVQHLRYICPRRIRRNQFSLLGKTVPQGIPCKHLSRWERTFLSGTSCSSSPHQLLLEFLVRRHIGQLGIRCRQIVHGTSICQLRTGSKLAPHQVVCIFQQCSRSTEEFPNYHVCVCQLGSPGTLWGLHLNPLVSTCLHHKLHKWNSLLPFRNSHCYNLRKPSSPRKHYASLRHRVHIRRYHLLPQYGQSHPRKSQEDTSSTLRFLPRSIPLLGSLGIAYAARWGTFLLGNRRISPGPRPPSC